MNIKIFVTKQATNQWRNRFEFPERKVKFEGRTYVMPGCEVEGEPRNFRAALWDALSQAHQFEKAGHKVTIMRQLPNGDFMADFHRRRAK